MMDSSRCISQSHKNLDRRALPAILFSQEKVRMSSRNVSNLFAGKQQENKGRGKQVFNLISSLACPTALPISKYM